MQFIFPHTILRFVSEFEAPKFAQPTTKYKKMRTLFILCISLSLIACTSTQVKIPHEQVAWADSVFDGLPSAPVISRDEVFRLDASLKEKLSDAKIQRLSVQERADYLLALIFGDNRSDFPYLSYNSGGAAETWTKKRGDCISLTILAYAIGKELKLPISMQEIDVPVQFDRQGRIEYFNTHVNAIILDSRLNLDSLGGSQNDVDSQTKQGYVIIDFEPEKSPPPRGVILKEQEILALFYNNLAAAYLAKNDTASAYAYFKAAITSAPTYSPSFSNLAQVYQRHQLSDAAEKILRQAILLNPKNILAVRDLHQLLLTQKRAAEADFYQKMLIAHAHEDPHYWIGLGLKSMQEKDYAAAIKNFERAQKLGQGYEEIHRNLAVAYLAIGDAKQAKKQFTLLIALSPGHPDRQFIKSKFAGR